MLNGKYDLSVPDVHICRDHLSLFTIPYIIVFQGYSLSGESKLHRTFGERCWGKKYLVFAAGPIKLQNQDVLTWLGASR